MSAVTFIPPEGWAELMGAIDQWRRAPNPPGAGGVLVLMCGAPVVAAFRAHSPGGAQLVPPLEGGGSYRQVGVHVTGWHHGHWRLLEDGEQVSAGDIEVPP